MTMNLSTIAQDMRSSILSRGHLPLHARKKKLEALKKVIVKKETLISKALKDDLGKSSFESYATEVGFILEEINFILKNIDNWAKPKKVKTPFTLFPCKSYVHPEPY